MLAAPPAPIPPVASPAAPPPVTATTAAVPPLRRIRLQPNLRLILPLLLVLAFVLAAISLGSAWWSYSSSNPSGSESVSFVPGADYYLTCTSSHCGGFQAGTQPYAAIGGSIGGVYGSLFGLLLAAVILSGLVALFAGLSAAGRTWGRWQAKATFLLGGGAILLLLASLVWATAGQPGAFAPGFYFPGSGSAGASPANSFWGSSSTGSASWGAGAGWYLALASLILLSGVIVVLPWINRRSRPAPARPISPGSGESTYVRREYMSGPPAPAVRGPVAVAPPVRTSSPTMLTPTAVTPPPVRPGPAPAEPTAPTVPPEIEAEPVPCTYCGTPNPAKARICSYCQRPLR